MARTSYSAEQQRIEREIARLQKRAEALQQKKRAPAIIQIVRTMREFGITPNDVAAAFGKGSRTKKLAAKNTKTTTAKKTIAPKYQDPASGKTWTGRGKPPRWLADAERAGARREQFLIAKA